jgi:hypothetical protein
LRRRRASLRRIVRDYILANAIILICYIPPLPLGLHGLASKTDRPTLRIRVKMTSPSPKTAQLLYLATICKHGLQTNNSNGKLCDAAPIQFICDNSSSNISASGRSVLARAANFKTFGNQQQNNTSCPTLYPANLIQGETTNKQTCRKGKEKAEKEGKAGNDKHSQPLLRACQRERNRQAHEQVTHIMQTAYTHPPHSTFAQA